MIYVVADGEDFEYFCKGCRQLRLCMKHPFEGCGNCGSEDVVKGEVGTLDKEALIVEHFE